MGAKNEQKTSEAACITLYDSKIHAALFAVSGPNESKTVLGDEAEFIILQQRKGVLKFKKFCYHEKHVI